MKNNLFQNDLEEIRAFIGAYPYSGNGNSEHCLRLLTEDIDEEYLTDRAKYISDVYRIDSSFVASLGIADSLCSSLSCEECPISKYCNHYIRAKRDSVNKDSLKMIDLFCGAGGLSLGFTQEGFVTSLANDIEPCCVDTYAHNHPETPRKYIVQGDINNILNNLESLLQYKDVDVIIGGPPCQSFSLANRQRIIDDPRNVLYKSFVEAVKRVQPKMFIMENVKGMLSVANQVIEDFEAIGYKTTARVLNAKDFGVPQSRERLIYIGNRIGVDNEEVFSRIIQSSESIPNTTLADALFGLKPLVASRIKNATDITTDGSGSKIAAASGETNSYIDYLNQGRTIHIVCNHKARYNNDRDIEIFGRMEPGDKSDDPKIADIMPYSRRNGIFKDKYYKLELDKICKTITAHMKFDCNMYIHPTQARGLTPREAARVQSYPDDYFFRGSFTKTYMQIGNSVPPLLGRAIAKVIKEYVSHTSEPENKEFNKQ